MSNTTQRKAARRKAKRQNKQQQYQHVQQRISKASLRYQLKKLWEFDDVNKPVGGIRNHGIEYVEVIGYSDDLTDDPDVFDLDSFHIGYNIVYRRGGHDNILYYMQRGEEPRLWVSDGITDEQIMRGSDDKRRVISLLYSELKDAVDSLCTDGCFNPEHFDRVSLAVLKMELQKGPRQARLLKESH